MLDLSNNKFESLPLQPNLKPMVYAPTNSVVYTVAEGNNRRYLLVKGMKANQPNAGIYSQKCYYDDKFFEFTILKPYVICYDITDLKGSQEQVVPNRLKVMQKNIDKELVEAPMHYDAKKLNRLLKEGANPNATDDFGHTALMYACNFTSLKMVKKLLKAGADPNITDPEGLHAYDYVMIPLMKNTPCTIQELAKIFKKLRKPLKKK